jgi:hypothetical protein
MRLVTVVLVMLMAGVSPGLAAVNDVVVAGSNEALSWDLAIVRIDRQCQADPQMVVIDAKNGLWSPEKRYQVLWIADKNDGDLVTIAPKSSQEQDPGNPGRGLTITGLFESVYQIPGSSNAVSSGLPKLYTGPGSIVWRYDIEIRDAEGNLICRVDPDICIRSASGGCAP